MILKKKAFTLIELMLVVIIVGIIAGFAFPAFQKSIAKSQVRQVRNNLYSISAANEIYNARNGKYWPSFGTGPFTTITDINNNLGTNLISTGNNMSYQCIWDFSDVYECKGVMTGGYGFTMRITKASPDPTCSPAIVGENPC